jgi:hypothetical protein
MHENKGNKAIVKILEVLDNVSRILNRRSKYGNNKVPYGEIKNKEGGAQERYGKKASH